MSNQHRLKRIKNVAYTMMPPVTMAMNKTSIWVLQLA